MVTPSVLGYLSNLVFGFIEFVLIIRIILKLLGANSVAPFARWIYETTQPLLTPFQGMFPNSVLDGGFVIEISALIALLVYVFIGYGVGEIIEMLSVSKKSRRRAVEEE